MSDSVVEQRMQQLLDQGGAGQDAGPGVDLFWEPGPGPTDLGGEPMIAKVLPRHGGGVGATRASSGG